ncbi:hypothetical protein D3C80_1728830 [compost metagenome]
MGPNGLGPSAYFGGIRGIFASDFVHSPTFGEIRGIFASDFVHSPTFGGIKGIFASDFVHSPTFSGIKGIFASDFVHSPTFGAKNKNQKAAQQAAYSSFFIPYIRSYSEPAFFTGRNTA